MEERQPYLTRRQIVEVAREELGVPISMSTINKASSDGSGPRPIARYGNNFLYEKADALEWAKSLVKPVTPSAQTA